MTRRSARFCFWRSLFAVPTRGEG